jgi:Icc-related predicted phosphoesterase
MKFSCIADTHTYHKEVDIPDCDVLLIAGDITFTGHFPDLIRFDKWLEMLDTLKVRKKIYIAGNHDKTHASHASYAESLIQNAIYLRDELVEVEGVKIWGAPWSPRFGHGWAFNKTRGDDIKKCWDLIPNETDILITHGPPLGHGDLVTADYSCNRGEKVGCWDLREALKRIKPKVHLFGHIHEGYGVTVLDHENGEKTYCINASVCTEHYEPSNKPIVFDLKKTGEISFPGLRLSTSIEGKNH